MSLKTTSCPNTGALTGVNFVVAYNDGTFSPALPPLFIVGVTGNGQLGQSYTFSGFDANTSTLPVADNANRSMVYFTWNFRNACANQARIGAESVAPLTLRLLGNPVNNLIEAEVTGAEGSSLNLVLSNLQGRSLDQQQIERAGASEVIRFNVGNQPSGMLLLRASTSTQGQTIKVLKQ